VLDPNRQLTSTQPTQTIALPRAIDFHSNFIIPFVMKYCCTGRA
jgi:hypothetical protein